MEWSKIFLAIGAILIIWVLVRFIKHDRQALSRENLGKSFNTMGMLALGLIAFIAVCVWLLRSGA